MPTASTIRGHRAIARQAPTDLWPDDDPRSANLRIWHLDAPGQSTLFEYYILSLQHLRPIDGIVPALGDELATHQLTLAALKPNRWAKDHRRPLRWTMMMPLNFYAQLLWLSDDEAIEVCDLAAAAVTRGELWAEPPLAGQREPWASTIITTIVHYHGAHGDH